MTFKLHPEARAEYREAINFYGRGAESFTNAVETAIAEIIRRPERFRELERVCEYAGYPNFHTRHYTRLKSKT